MTQREHMYTCGGFILIFGKSNNSYVKFKNKIKLKKKKKRTLACFSIFHAFSGCARCLPTVVCLLREGVLPRGGPRGGPSRWFARFCLPVPLIRVDTVHFTGRSVMYAGSWCLQGIDIIPKCEALTTRSILFLWKTRSICISLQLNILKAYL